MNRSHRFSWKSLPSRGRQAAQSTVEFAIVAPLFFILVFGIFDFGRLFFTQMTLQHALREGGRFAVTGRTLPNPDGGQFSRNDSIKEVIRKSVVGLELDPQNIAIDDGGPGQPISITMDYDLTLITPIIGQFFNGGTYEFTVGTTFKNERYPVN